MVRFRPIRSFLAVPSPGELLPPRFLAGAGRLSHPVMRDYVDSIQVRYANDEVCLRRPCVRYFLYLSVFFLGRILATVFRWLLGGRLGKDGPPTHYHHHRGQSFPLPMVVGVGVNGHCFLDNYRRLEDPWFVFVGWPQFGTGSVLFGGVPPVWVVMCRKSVAPTVRRS